MEKEKVTRIGVSLPPKLLKKFDSLIKDMGYANRSEAIRDSVRGYILKNELKIEKGKLVGIISIIYDHDVHGITEVITDLQHRYHEIIQSNTHIHLDKNNCMEIIIVRGNSKKIKEIKDRLTSVSGVKHTDMLITTSVKY